MHNNLNTAVRSLTSIGLLVLISACASEQGDLQAYIAETKGRPPAPIEPIPPIQVSDEFEYREDGLRDPFLGAKPDRTANDSDTPKPDPDRRKQPLERYPLDTLKMVGNLVRQGKNWALVQDPEGIVHRVSPGDYLGQNDGRVSLIKEDEIQLDELLADGAGGWIQREAQISLVVPGEGP